MYSFTKNASIARYLRRHIEFEDKDNMDLKKTHCHGYLYQCNVGKISPDSAFSSAFYSVDVKIHAPFSDTANQSDDQITFSALIVHMYSVKSSYSVD